MSVLAMNFILPDGVPEPWDAALRLLIAALLGAIIGAEREHHGRAAGVRTQFLVALGSALAMVVSLHFGDVYGQGASSGAIRIDPARVAYGVMGGIGFLGAGAILRYGIGIRGLTTAASLWCSAAIGLACGFGMIALSILAVVLVIFALVLLVRLERLLPARQTRTLAIRLPISAGDQASRIADMLRTHNIRVINTDYALRKSENAQILTFHLSAPAGPKTSLAHIHALVEGLPEIESLDLS